LNQVSLIRETKKTGLLYLKTGLRSFGTGLGNTLTNCPLTNNLKYIVLFFLQRRLLYVENSKEEFWMNN